MSSTVGFFERTMGCVVSLRLGFMSNGEDGDTTFERVNLNKLWRDSIVWLVLYCLNLSTDLQYDIS